MPDITEAFAALERLDEDGYKAVSLATLMLQEKLRDATARPSSLHNRHSQPPRLPVSPDLTPEPTLHHHDSFGIAQQA